MPITLYAADIDLSGINREQAKKRLESVDAGGSVLDGVIEKAVVDFANSPRISSASPSYPSNTDDSHCPSDGNCFIVIESGKNGYDLLDVEIQCTGGKYKGEKRCIEQNTKGKWRGDCGYFSAALGYKFSNMTETANYACNR